MLWFSTAGSIFRDINNLCYSLIVVSMRLISSVIGKHCVFYVFFFMYTWFCKTDNTGLLIFLNPDRWGSEMKGFIVRRIMIIVHILQSAFNYGFRWLLLSSYNILHLLTTLIILYFIHCLLKITYTASCIRQQKLGSPYVPYPAMFASHGQLAFKGLGEQGQGPTLGLVRPPVIYI